MVVLNSVIPLTIIRELYRRKWEFSFANQKLEHNKETLQNSSPIQTILSVLDFHQLHRYLIKYRVTDLQNLFCSPPVRNFTLPRGILFVLLSFS